MSRLRRIIRGNSLRVQLMLYFLLVSVIIMTAGSYLIYQNIIGMLKQRNEELVLQRFDQSQQSILGLFEEIDRLSGLFLLDENVQQYFQAGVFRPVYDDVMMVNGIFKKADEIISNYPYIDSIYLFSNDREAVGMSGRYSLIAGGDKEEHPFFATNMYREASVDTKSKWYGGYTSAFFNDAFRYGVVSDGHLISHVRGVSMYPIGHRGAVVFNIDESYLHAMYASPDERDASFIADSDGVTISAYDKERIGERTDMPGEMDERGLYGSISMNTDEGPVQLIYRENRELGWFLIKEMPLSGDAEYAMAAQRNFIVGISALSLLVIFALSFFWLRHISGPLRRLTVSMAEVGQGNLGLSVEDMPNNEIGFVIDKFNEMSHSIGELMFENERIEREKRELEIEALQAQINPHFLYNTLNTIKWMAAGGAPRDEGNRAVVDSIVALGNILRPIYKTRETIWRLEDELGYLSNYIKIMSRRYNDVITFLIDIRCELRECKVPRFILQPIVENSIEHGLSGCERLILSISAEERDDDLDIIVLDNGAGIQSDRLEALNRSLLAPSGSADIEGEQKIGMMNVMRRIRLYFGDRYGITVSCPPNGGTRVCLAIKKEVANHRISK